MIMFSCNFCIKCEHSSLGSLEVLRLRGIEDLGCRVVFWYHHTCGKDLLLTSAVSAESHLGASWVPGCICKHHVNEYTD